LKNNQTISLRVKAIIAEALNLDISKIHDTASQENFFAWDSMAYLSILSSIEDEFNVPVSAENIDEFGSVTQIINQINQCQQK